MKLMNIDADTLTIPETEYNAHIMFPLTEFMCIVCDLSQLSESMHIKVSKEGVQFMSNSKATNGSILLKQSNVGHVGGAMIKPKVEEGTEGAGEGDEETKEEEDGEEGSGKKLKKPKIKKEMADKDNHKEDEELFKPKVDNNKDSKDSKDEKDSKGRQQ